LVAAEVELDERPARELAGAMVHQRRAQEARLEDRDARTKSVPDEKIGDVADVTVAVDVDELDRTGEAILSGPAQIHRAGVEPPHAHQPRFGEGRYVSESVLDRSADGDGCIQYCIGVLGDRGTPAPEVAFRRGRSLQREVVDVGVNHGRTGLETAQRVGSDL